MEMMNIGTRAIPTVSGDAPTEFDVDLNRNTTTNSEMEMVNIDTRAIPTVSGDAPTEFHVDLNLNTTTNREMEMVNIDTRAIPTVSGDAPTEFDVDSIATQLQTELIGAPGLRGRSWPDLDMLPLGWLTNPNGSKVNNIDWFIRIWNLSRNRTVGMRLGSGEKLDEILFSMNHVAEGVSTAGAIIALAQKYNVKMPVARIIDNELTPQKTILELMSLPLLQFRISL